MKGDVGPAWLIIIIINDGISIRRSEDQEREARPLHFPTGTKIGGKKESLRFLIGKTFFRFGTKRLRDREVGERFGKIKARAR